MGKEIQPRYYFDLQKEKEIKKQENPDYDFKTNIAIFYREGGKTQGLIKFICESDENHKFLWLVMSRSELQDFSFEEFIQDAQSMGNWDETIEYSNYKFYRNGNVIGYLKAINNAKLDKKKRDTSVDKIIVDEFNQVPYILASTFVEKLLTIRNTYTNKNCEVWYLANTDTKMSMELFTYYNIITLENENGWNYFYTEKPDGTKAPKVAVLRKTRTEEEADEYFKDDPKYWEIRGTPYWRMAYLGEFVLSDPFNVVELTEEEISPKAVFFNGVDYLILSKRYNTTYNDRKVENHIIVYHDYQIEEHLENEKLPVYVLNKKYIKEGRVFNTTFLNQFLKQFIKGNITYQNQWSKDAFKILLGVK